MHFGIKLGGYLAAIVFALSLFPASSPGSPAKAANGATLAMLLQSVGKTEKQCRIDREACLVSANRCKSNYNYEDRLTQQCRTNARNRYKRCESRRLQTLPKTRSHPGANQQQRTMNADRAKREAVLKACGRRPGGIDLQKACPARQGSCKSPGYCTQQYQYCSSSAYAKDRSNAGQPETQRPAAAPPPVRRRPNSVPKSDWSLDALKKSGKKIIVRRDNRPIIYKASIENTCKKPIPVAYGTLTNGKKHIKLQTRGWESLKPGMNIIDFPKTSADYMIYLKRGELFRIMKNRTLQARKHDSRTLFSLVDNQDFDVAHVHRDPPNIPNLRKARFAMITQAFKKDMYRFKIKKCGKKRKLRSN